MENNEPQQVVVQGTPVEQGKKVTQFGAIDFPTPVWAKWLFRSVLIFTTAATIWIAGTELISKASKVELMLLLKVVDALVYGFSKLFGIVPADDK